MDDSTKVDIAWLYSLFVCFSQICIKCVVSI